MGIRISLFPLGFLGGIRNYESYNKKVPKELCRKSSLFDGIRKKILKTSRSSHFIRYKLPISDFVQIGTPYFSLEHVVSAILESGLRGKYLECYHFHFSFYV